MEGYTKLGFTGGGGGTNPAVNRFGFGFIQGAEAAAAEKGVNVNIIKLHQIKPVPNEAVKCAMNAGRIFFFEEGQRFGGIGQTFADKLLKYGYRGAYNNTGVEGQFAVQNTVEGLLARYRLDAAGMARVITEEERNDG